MAGQDGRTPDPSAPSFIVSMREAFLLSFDGNRWRVGLYQLFRECGGIASRRNSSGTIDALVSVV